MQNEWHHEELSSFNEVNSTDTVLHNVFSPVVDPRPHEHIGPGVVGKAGYWIVTDRRSGRAFYGHA